MDSVLPGVLMYTSIRAPSGLSRLITVRIIEIMQEIIVAARGSDIEKIGAPARFHGLGQNLIGVVLAFAADLNLG